VSSEPTPVVMPATAPLFSILADKAQHLATSLLVLSRHNLNPVPTTSIL
jgi:hypothetical protein